MLKKTLLSIGLTCSLYSGQVLASGHIFIWNYGTAPYNQVLWENGRAVNDSSVEVQVWYGKGTISDASLLSPGVIMPINPAFNYDPGRGHGAGGYYMEVVQSLPTWTSGDTFTFQLRAQYSFGGFVMPLGSSALWLERYEITDSTVPARLSTFVPELVLVPEPSAFSIFGIAGILGYSFWRCRIRAED